MAMAFIAVFFASQICWQPPTSRQAVHVTPTVNATTNTKTLVDADEGLKGEPKSKARKKNEGRKRAKARARVLVEAGGEGVK